MYFNINCYVNTLSDNILTDSWKWNVNILIQEPDLLYKITLFYEPLPEKTVCVKEN